MVNIREPSDHEKLDEIIKALVDQHQLTLYTDGWARKTYRIYQADENRQKNLLIQVESLVTNNGEIYYYHDDALVIAKDIAEQVENAFNLEVTLIKKKID